MKTADGVATASVLSPKQLQQIDAKRTAYLTEKPDMNSDEIQELIRKNLGAVESRCIRLIWNSSKLHISQWTLPLRILIRSTEFDISILQNG